MVLFNIFRSDGLRLVKLAAVACSDAQLLARAQQTLGQLAVIGGVIAIDKGIVTSLEDETSNVHGFYAQPGSSRR